MRYELSIINLRLVKTPSFEHDSIVFLCDELHKQADIESIENNKPELKDYFECLLLMTYELDGGSRNVFLEKPMELPLWLSKKAIA